MNFDSSNFALGSCNESELNIIYSNDSISVIEEKLKKPKKKKHQIYETNSDFKSIKDNIVLDNNDFLSHDSVYNTTTCKYYST